jgi:hypothetical protein
MLTTPIIYANYGLRLILSQRRYRIIRQHCDNSIGKRHFRVGGELGWLTCKAGTLDSERSLRALRIDGCPDASRSASPPLTAGSCSALTRQNTSFNYRCPLVAALLSFSRSHFLFFSLSPPFPLRMTSPLSLRRITSSTIQILFPTILFPNFSHWVSYGF